MTDEVQDEALLKQPSIEPSKHNVKDNYPWHLLIRTVVLLNAFLGENTNLHIWSQCKLLNYFSSWCNRWSDWSNSPGSQRSVWSVNWTNFNLVDDEQFWIYDWMFYNWNDPG